jgi:hypothetical protein
MNMLSQIEYMPAFDFPPPFAPNAIFLPFPAARKSSPSLKSSILPLPKDHVVATQGLE